MIQRLHGSVRALVLIGAATPLLMACDSATIPKDHALEGADALSQRPWTWVLDRGIWSRFMPVDAEIRDDRDLMLDRFGRAQVQASTPEEIENLRLTIQRLQEMDGPAASAEIAAVGDVAADAAYSTSPPLAITYMNLSPEAGAYWLSGTTAVQTEGVSARITHNLYWTVGSTSRRLLGHNSITARTIFTTWVDFTCGDVMSVTAYTDSHRLFTTGHETWGQGYLSTQTCQPLQPVGCSDPNSPYLTDPGHETYDPYEGGGGCGGGGGGGDDGDAGNGGGSGNCTTEYVEIEVWDGERWVTWWAGEATVCE